jgi:hypothetical protein
MEPKKHQEQESHPLDYDTRNRRMNVAMQDIRRWKNHAIEQVSLHEERLKKLLDDDTAHILTVFDAFMGRGDDSWTDVTIEDSRDLVRAQIDEEELDILVEALESLRLEHDP